MARPQKIPAEDGEHPFENNLAAIGLTVVATFVITGILSFPRAVLFVDLFTGYVRDSGSVMVFPHDVRVAILIFDACVITFAYAAGAASMAFARFVFPKADPKRIMLVVTCSLIFYAIVIAIPGLQVASFLPTHMDLAIAIPGSFLGYLVAGGSPMRKRLNRSTIPIFLVVTIFSALAVGVTPAWVQFSLPCGLQCGQIIPSMEYGPRP